MCRKLAFFFDMLCLHTRWSKGVVIERFALYIAGSSIFLWKCGCVNNQLHVEQQRCQWISENITHWPWGNIVAVDLLPTLLLQIWFPWIKSNLLGWIYSPLHGHLHPKWWICPGVNPGHWLSIVSLTHLALLEWEHAVLGKLYPP